MTESTPHIATSPPFSDNGAARAPASAPPAPKPSVAPTPRHEPLRSRIGQVRTALIAGAVALILVLIFIIENARAVTIVYFGAHLRLSLAVALLLAAIGGALVMAAAGTARITQLRLGMRRSRHQRHDG